MSVHHNDNGDKIYHFYVPPPQVVYFGYILESLEGWAFYTTIDDQKSIMHIEVIKDYVHDFDKLLQVLMAP
ncbi:MAG: DUF4911 domain-containing protein [Candidatus Cloacimonetes bacterium]|nr:DUF4911 domain-containing protein [Candidatus Cloacimonadota bacterium]